MKKHQINSVDQNVRDTGYSNYKALITRIYLIPGKIYLGKNLFGFIWVMTKLKVKSSRLGPIWFQVIIVFISCNKRPLISVQSSVQYKLRGRKNEKIGLHCCLLGASKNNVLDYKKGQ